MQRAELATRKQVSPRLTTMVLSDNKRFNSARTSSRFLRTETCASSKFRALGPAFQPMPKCAIG
jgi:hypothetical protein